MEILVLTISLQPTFGEFPYQWRVINGFTGEEVDGGWTDVASEDEAEWFSLADAFIRTQGYRRPSQNGWLTDDEGALSGVIVKRV